MTWIINKIATTIKWNVNYMCTHVKCALLQLHDIIHYLLFTDIYVDSKLTVAKNSRFYLICLYTLQLTKSSNNLLRQMSSRYFVQSADCGTGTTSGSVDGWELEAGKASWKTEKQLLSEILCPILIFSSSSTLGYTVKDWTDLWPTTAMVWDGPYISFDKIVAPVTRMEWFV